jgi:hypothetical protein
VSLSCQRFSCSARLKRADADLFSSELMSSADEAQLRRLEKNGRPDFRAKRRDEKKTLFAILCCVARPRHTSLLCARNESDTTGRHVERSNSFDRGGDLASGRHAVRVRRQQEVEPLSFSHETICPSAAVASLWSPIENGARH